MGYSFIILVCSWKYVGWLTADDSPSHCSHVPGEEQPLITRCRMPRLCGPIITHQGALYHLSEAISSCSRPTVNYYPQMLGTRTSAPCIRHKLDIILSTLS